VVVTACAVAVDFLLVVECRIGATCAKFKLAANKASNRSPRDRRTTWMLTAMLTDGPRRVNLLWALIAQQLQGRRSSCDLVAQRQAMRSPYNRLGLDAAGGISFALFVGHDAMKNFLRLVAVLFVFSVISLAYAGNYVSRIVLMSDMFTIDVPGDHFLVIRNFTQEGTFSAITTRGQITATDKNGFTGTVITATIADTDPTTVLEPVNEVVIAGPSTVTVTGGNTSCFLTYRKGQD
jgi:hypothetical protein